VQALLCHAKEAGGEGDEGVMRLALMKDIYGCVLTKLDPEVAKTLDHSCLLGWIARVISRSWHGMMRTAQTPGSYTAIRWQKRIRSDEALISRDIPSFRCSGLHYAAACGQADIVRMMLSMKEGNKLQSVVVKSPCLAFCPSGAKSYAACPIVTYPPERFHTMVVIR
jgi:hypothetical protein